MLAHTLTLDGMVVEIRSTSRADGDFAVLADADEPDELRSFELDGLRRGIVDAPWTWLRQTHDTTVVEVDSPGHRAGARADGALTTVPGCPIAVTTADCSPLVLVTTKGVAVVHAGWKGAQAGIVEQAGSLLVARGGEPVVAVLGPCITAPAYEFGPADLDAMADRFGAKVRSRTAAGTPALDMVAVIGEACRAIGWDPPVPSACTSDQAWFSHRTRGDRGRQTTVAWIGRS